MEPTLLTFAWRNSKPQQLMILALTIASFPVVYFSLEIPKIIINEAINGTGFPRRVLGVELDQIDYLIALSVLFITLVLAINGFKWLINVSIGLTGERLLRRLRYVIYEHVMRFRPARFRTTRPGEIIQSMLGEIEPLGGFFGEVIATPVFQGGLLAVYVTFIFVQDFWLGLAAVSLYPLQAFLIPKLQAKIVRLNRDRARNTRTLADWIGESVGNISEIHTNDTARWHLAQVSQRLHVNTMIRKALFERKFTIKFLNNLLNQVPPFFFYSVGGYMVIVGRLDFGALVAVLAAYREVSGPWKELLGFWQRWTDFSSRYLFVVEGFVGTDLHDPARLQAGGPPLAGEMVLRDVTGGPGTAGLTVPDLVVRPGETVAISGGETGAREALLRLMAGLATPASGTVRIGGHELGEATLAQLGSAVAYIGREPGMFSGSLRQNLLYGLLRDAPEQAADRATATYLREARMTGNSTADPDGDWIDYAAAGVADADALEARLERLIDRFGLGEEISSVALNSRVPITEAEAWTALTRAARRRFATLAPDLVELIEMWEPGRYNTNAPLIANLLFAVPITAEDDIAGQLATDSITGILEASGGAPILEEVGRDLAGEFRSVVDAVGIESPVLERFAGYSRQEILDAAAWAATASASGTTRRGANRAMLRSLGARFVERRDQFDLLPPERKARILAARARARPLAAESTKLVALDSERFNPGRTLLANILPGPRRLERRAAWKRLDEAVEAAVEAAIDAEGLRPALIRLGLAQPLAAAGLSGSALRQVALVRAVLKRPHYLLLDGLAGGETAADAELRQTIRDELPESALLYAAAGTAATTGASRVLHIAPNGELGDEGPGPDMPPPQTDGKAPDGPQPPTRAGR